MKILPFEGDSMDDTIEKDYKVKTPVRTVERGLAPSHLLTIMMTKNPNGKDVKPAR